MALDLASHTPGAKIFNCVIHDVMRFDPLYLAVIDTPQFQRLRELKQVRRWLRAAGRACEAGLRAAAAAPQRWFLPVAAAASEAVGGPSSGPCKPAHSQPCRRPAEG